MFSVLIVIMALLCVVSYAKLLNIQREVRVLNCQSDLTPNYLPICYEPLPPSFSQTSQRKHLHVIIAGTNLCDILTVMFSIFSGVEDSVHSDMSSLTCYSCLLDGATCIRVGTANMLR